MSTPLYSTPELTVRQLHPPVITAWRIGTAFRTLVWAALLAAGWMLMPPPYSLPLGVAAAVIVAGGILSMILHAPARWRRWTFEVGAHDLRLRHGVFWRTESVVPHVRIQHVDTHHGPIDRWLGLSTVIVYTAGRVGGALPIPGLATAEAEALRDQLASLSGSDDAV
jgi:uncharacterized protein